jgi:hypothetical protein
MMDHLQAYFPRNYHIQLIINEYMQLFDTIENHFVSCHTPPPLGYITASLYHLAYQYLFDRHFMDNYPDLFSHDGVILYLLLRNSIRRIRSMKKR